MGTIALILFFGGIRGCAETGPGLSFGGLRLWAPWNVLSLSEDQRLPYLSDKLRGLKMDIVGLSEKKKRHENSWISSSRLLVYTASEAEAHTELYVMY